jgi:predicted ArsR family transcriptional regulator
MPGPALARDMAALEIPLDRDSFLRDLVRVLAGALEDTVGLNEASGFVSIVGQTIGDQINQEYQNALGVPVLTKDQVGRVLVDLKRRIQGDFYIIEQDEDRIVLGNRACPFGDRVLNRPSMCMMTSNVFGSIAAENLGYAKVELQETIAQGDAGCRIVVHLKPTPGAEAAEGREYFKTG